MNSRHTANIAFDNSYARELEGLYAPWPPSPSPAPSLFKLNAPLAEELGLPPEALTATVLAGNLVPAGAQPIAQAYAGHQFGGFSPSLGDGRAVLLGEVIDTFGQRRDIAFKGSGRTPFSRNGDGKAVLGPMLREYLIGEALHALSIPCTRALAVALTGETVQRDTPQPGAVLTRVAASHIRVGTFEYFAARDERDKLQQLADYTIARHYPELASQPERYLDLLQAAAERQARLLAQWLHVGFIHGVMNTDNMALSGESIDFGPCAFMDAYDPATVFSSIDHQGRYAYGNQPWIAQWNLARFAEALLPLIAPEDPQRAVAPATAILEAWPQRFQEHWLQGARAKLGLTREQEGDARLAEDWLTLLHAQAVDFTLGWRYLADAAEGRPEQLLGLFAEPQPVLEWLLRWQQRATPEGNGVERAAAMRRVNPLYIPRNHLVEEALQAATAGDAAPFEKLLTVLAAPYTERADLERYALPAPTSFNADYRTFCGT